MVHLFEAEPTRASVNVALDPTLLARLVARVGAPRGLTVHRMVELSDGSVTPHEIEEQISHDLAEAQAQAASEVQACRFRPQPKILISLRLRDRVLGDAGVQAVAQALLLRAPLTLQVLTLSGVGASDAGINALAEALAATNVVQLLSLDLSGNRLTDAAGMPLAALLAAPKQRLEELRLSSNRLGDRGTIALANGLVANRALTNLSLGHNGVGVSGVRALDTALRSHRTLSTLSLPGNRLSGQAGAEAVTEMVSHAQCLTRLSLSDNELGPHVAAALASLFDGQPHSHRADGGIGPGAHADFDAAAALDPHANAIANAVTDSTAGTAGVSGDWLAGIGAPLPPAIRPPPLQPTIVLSCLDLERSRLRAEGSVGIALLLSQMRFVLAELYLGGNRLGDAGAGELARVLGGAQARSRSRGRQQC